jgi:hypothetical protein
MLIRSMRWYKSNVRKIISDISSLLFLLFFSYHYFIFHFFPIHSESHPFPYLTSSYQTRRLELSCPARPLGSRGGIRGGGSTPVHRSPPWLQRVARPMIPPLGGGIVGGWPPQPTLAGGTQANHNGGFHIPISKNTTSAWGMNETLCLNGEFHFTVSKANQCN